MGARRRVAILFHRNQREGTARRYLIHYIADVWRAEGIEVIYLFGPDRVVEADVIIVHVDLSVVPDEYLEFAARYPVAINGRVKDIRKSSFSRLRVSRDSHFNGPVIVKADCNYGGVPERMFAEPPGWRQRILFALPALEVQLRRSSRFRRKAPHPIFKTLAEVPTRYLESVDYIVERFVPEIEGDTYFTRYLDFLGDRHSCVRFPSNDPIVPGSARRPAAVDVEPPPELFELRRRMGLDYGKLDYVEVEGRVHVFDVNKTIGTGGAPINTELTERRLRTYAEGIYSYLR